jgi:hypothetical protein
MKRLVLGMSAAALLTWMAAPMLAETKTVRGEVVDVQCQMKDTNKKGMDHAKCATACAKKGGAMGILTSDGVYTITGNYAKDNNEKLLAFIAKNVEAKGDVTEKDGKYEIDVASMEAAK